MNRFSPSPIDDPDPQFDWNYVRGTLVPNKASIIVVENSSCEQFWRYPRYARDVGNMLFRDYIGRYSRSQFDPRIVHFFEVHTKRLADSLDLIKRSLAMRGLLPHSKIGLADPELEMWRTFYPSIGPIPEAISGL